MKIREYVRIPGRLAEYRRHVQDYHTPPSSGMVEQELREDGYRILELCNYIEALMALLEKEENNDET